MLNVEIVLENPLHTKQKKKGIMNILGIFWGKLSAQLSPDIFMIPNVYYSVHLTFDRDIANIQPILIFPVYNIFPVMKHSLGLFTTIPLSGVMKTKTD